MSGNSANCSPSHVKLDRNDRYCAAQQQLAVNTRLLHLEQQPRNNLLPFLTSEFPASLSFSVEHDLIGGLGMGASIVASDDWIGSDQLFSRPKKHIYEH